MIVALDSALYTLDELGRRVSVDSVGRVDVVRVVGHGRVHSDGRGLVFFDGRSIECPRISSIVVCPDGRSLGVVFETTVVVYDTSTLEERLRREYGSRTTIAYTPDGLSFIIVNTAIVVYDTHDYTVVTESDYERPCPRTLVFSKNSTEFLPLSKNYVYNLRTLAFTPINDCPIAGAIGLDGVLRIVDSDFRVRVLDDDYACVRSYGLIGKPNTCLEFLMNAVHVVAYSGKRMYVWDALTGYPIAPIEFENRITSVELLPVNVLL